GGAYIEREVLSGVGDHAVGRGDRDRVATDGARRGRAGERCGAIAVVDEHHTCGERPGLGERRGWCAGGDDRELGGGTGREPGVVRDRDFRRVFDGEREFLDRVG